MGGIYKKIAPIHFLKNYKIKYNLQNKQQFRIRVVFHVKWKRNLKF